MHGVKRGERPVSTSSELEAFLSANEAFQSSKTPEQVLVSTKNLLTINPEIYSAWAARRRALAPLLAAGGADEADDAEKRAKDKDERMGLVKAELKFNQAALAMNPKSYWVWLHRKWVIERSGNAGELLKGELEKCAALLKLDDRNFHCWSYRDWLVAQLPGDDGARREVDMQFTTGKIGENFSNYSAWHRRSAVLLSGSEDDASALETIRAELDLVQQAYYCEPEDQSAWLYHRWLVARPAASRSEELIRGEVQKCRELLEVEPGSKWTALTLSLLLRRLPDGLPEALALVESLEASDAARAGYYRWDRTGLLVSMLPRDGARASLSKSRIADLAVPGWAALSGTLTDLDLSDNDITSLEGLGALTSLARLDLSRNKLRAIKKGWIDGLQGLKTIVLTGNPLPANTQDLFLPEGAKVE